MSDRPYTTPDPPPLPVNRVTEAPPFSITGVDYTSALYNQNADGSASIAYICLFTCANTRAVYLEVVTIISQKTGSHYHA